jgi:hypothetical protein
MTTIYDKYEKLLAEQTSILEQIVEFNDIIKKIETIDSDLINENKRLTKDNAHLLYETIKEKHKYIELESKYNELKSKYDKMSNKIKKFTLDTVKY